MGHKPLIIKSDLRLALAVGLSAGLLITLGLPYPYYGPMAVGAALGGTLGASRIASIQRMQGTLLGGVIVFISYSTLAQAVPLPVGVGVALASTRLFGGALGLLSGYKVAGLVVAMGWTIHAGNLDSWIPYRLVDTLVGVLVALLVVGAFWPSRALDQHGAISKQLLNDFAEAFRERAQLLRRGDELNADTRITTRNQLLNKIVQIQAKRPEALVELGEDRTGQLLTRLWDLEEQLFSEMISIYRTLLRLPPVPHSSPALQKLVGAEAELFDAVSARLELWSKHWPGGSGLGRILADQSSLHLSQERLEAAEADVFDDPAAMAVLLSSTGGRRAMACHQLLNVVASFEDAWLATF
ncbi:FUSC family protein [Cyanobium sp. WAJ14-Wanaka]|uniref:FUSC family protein n=1 Tax=Cyanobium sp. WAJ14-Wanaka TaxID=2823725 RepID=UPI0020CEA6CB|nr:FUSC family protein [Cyanobium sp. WAJ14-Wanaka]MCP9774259.1 FUSC family protein [Cyanobium sp. WAJ14-Wanaka]